MNVKENLSKMPSGKGEFEDLFDTSKPIWERIKTVEDAIEYTGMKLPENIEELPVDVKAMMKLRIVVAAYNELSADTLNEFPKFERDEYRYYPWYTIYWKDEIDEMTEEEKARVVRRGCIYSGLLGGVGCAFCMSDSSLPYAFGGSRLAFKTREAALECGKRFIDLWLDYCFIPREGF